ncbi:unnamed protein product [Enterobius vermicularis]|uniref:Neur_chan_LBD domain-containing protein n=1 Tax=Enterobius vermicularis TaxID=51028 RepID=A0A0N4VM86_ENTVE|nr:unnamed protein product [Enterobius vermicularis]
MVAVNIYLRSISKIDDVNMEYSAQFTFREEWHDERLSFQKLQNATSEVTLYILHDINISVIVPNFVILTVSETPDSSQQIWMPDTFFQNEKEARRHLIDKPNVLIRIHADGRILYSVRLSLVLSCPMSLEYYPLDFQQCYIDLASYAYTTTDIVYDWKAEMPIQIKDGLNRSLPSFQLEEVKTNYCTSHTATGLF